jgi:hypothetical protein
MPKNLVVSWYTSEADLGRGELLRNFPDYSFPPCSLCSSLTWLLTAMGLHCPTSKAAEFVKPAAAAATLAVLLAFDLSVWDFPDVLLGDLRGIVRGSSEAGPSGALLRTFPQLRSRAANPSGHLPNSRRMRGRGREWTRAAITPPSQPCHRAGLSRAILALPSGGVKSILRLLTYL